LNYLIDTNVLSELRRPQPQQAVLDWFDQHPRRSLYLSVLTLGEIRKGIDKLPAGTRRQALDAWLSQDLPLYFSGRLLTLDAATAQAWGQLCARVQRPLPAIDGLLAATALHHGMTLVTRNTRDFEGLGLPLVNPWPQNA
jgi:predicted nucleic acid-binding protein